MTRCLLLHDGGDEDRRVHLVAGRHRRQGRLEVSPRGRRQASPRGRDERPQCARRRPGCTLRVIGGACERVRRARFVERGVRVVELLAEGIRVRVRFEVGQSDRHREKLCRQSVRRARVAAHSEDLAAVNGGDRARSRSPKCSRPSSSSASRTGYGLPRAQISCSRQLPGRRASRCGRATLWPRSSIR